MILRHIAAAAAVLAMSGCVAHRPAWETDGNPTGESTIAIIRVVPADATVWFTAGEISGRDFVKTGAPIDANFFGPDANGFRTAVFPKGTTIAVAKTWFNRKDREPAVRMERWLCDGHPSQSFVIPSGKVVYLGTLELDAEYPRLIMKVHPDIDLGRQYVATKLPKVTAPVELAQSQPVAMTERCPREEMPQIPSFMLR